MIRSGLSIRLALLVTGAALTAGLTALSVSRTVLCAVWLAAGLLWLHEQVSAALRGSRKRTVAALLRTGVVLGGLWGLLAADAVGGKEALVAATWIYPGTALSYLFWKNEDD